MEWECKTLNEITKLKETISHQPIPENLKSQVEAKIKQASQPRLDYAKRLEAEKKKTKLRLLKTEGRMVELDCKIKDSLSVTRPNCDAAITAIDELNNLTLSPLMLLKHPYVVHTVMKLKRYIGPKDNGEYTPDQKVNLTMSSLYP